MSGGILQLVAYGAQDIYLTGNPQITFFKMIYRRYTNFAMETMEDTFDSKPEFGKQISFTVKRKGDLLRLVYFRIVLSNIKLNENEMFAWTNFIGLSMFNYVEIEIGGTRIDRQYGDWLLIWLSLARNSEQNKGISKTLGFVPELIDYNNLDKPEYILYVPLPRFVQFIPLISLQYHEIRIHVKFNQAKDIIIANSKFLLNNGLNRVKIKEGTVLLDYIFLDSEERRRFAQVGHEYIIQQMQFTGAETAINKINNYKLNFNHPTKEIIWATINGNYRTGKRFLYYTPLYYSPYNFDKQTILKAASEKILRESILILDKNKIKDLERNKCLKIFFPNSCLKTTKNGKINIYNLSKDKIIVINTNSLTIGCYNLINKIYANVILKNNKLIVDILKTKISIRDLSIPVEKYQDSRFVKDDPHVNIYGNYGTLIDGSVNPVESATILFNGIERFSKREGDYFNYVLPDQYHNNTPVDGINVYSFAFKPTELKSTGTANLSRIDDVVLQVKFKDKTKKDGLPDIGLLNLDNRLIIFGLSYNIARIMSGMFGLAYSN